jgi:hypothetical protein
MHPAGAPPTLTAKIIQKPPKWWLKKLKPASEDGAF